MQTHRTLALSLLALSITLPAAFGQVNEDIKILASDGAPSDVYGSAVGVAGNRVIVGSQWDDDNGSGSGSAYIYNATTGLELAKLIASNGEPNDSFGRAVAINGDRAIIGAEGEDGDPFLTDSGTVYVFDLDTEQELFQLRPMDVFAGYRFGASISVSGDLAAIGAYGSNEQGTQSGTAYIFNVRTAQELFKMTPVDSAAGDRFGRAIGISGTSVVAGSANDDDNGSNSGSAYVFDGTTGLEVFKLLASDGIAGDRFGTAVAISGDRAVIGAPSSGPNGQRSGAVYVFDISTGLQIAKLVPSDGEAFDGFGSQVGISDGRIVVSSDEDDDNGNASGSVYVFDLATQLQVDKYLPSDGDTEDFFGFALAMSGGTTVVGSPFNDDNGSQSGSAYIFEDSDGAGSSYCDPAVINSTNEFGKIAVLGSILASANNFALQASDLPLNQFGFFLGGTQSVLVMNPAGSNGNLCVGGNLVRFNAASQIGVADAFGVFSRNLDLTAFPANPTVAVQAGDTWYFQCWHRENNGQSNFTTATAVTFE